MGTARKLKRTQLKQLQKQMNAKDPYWYVRDYKQGMWTVHQHKNCFLSIFYKGEFKVCLQYNRPLNDLQIRALLHKYIVDPDSFKRYIQEETE